MGRWLDGDTTDISKLGTKRHILTDKKGMPFLIIIASASTHDIKTVTDVLDNVIIKRNSKSSFTKNNTRKQQQQHLCLDRAYSSKSTRLQITNREYVPHIPFKIKRGEDKYKEKVSTKRYPARSWVV